MYVGEKIGASECVGGYVHRVSVYTASRVTVVHFSTDSRTVEVF